MYAAPDYSIPPPPSFSSASRSSTTYAGFWIRAIAYLIDTTLLSVLGLFVSRFDFQTANAYTGLLTLVYFPLFWSNLLGGATPAMRLFSLRVVGGDGNSIGVKRAFLRLLGLILSFLFLDIGVIWVAFDPEKRGWHDHLTNTRVIRTLHL